MAQARRSQFRAPSGRTVFDWLIGTGFLSVDAGAFFVALMLLLPWNLYRTPGDLWVAQPLRTWAFLLSFHALVVGAIALARTIASTPTTVSGASQTGLRVSSDWSAPRPAPQARQTASTLLTQEWARRWLEDDRAETAEMLRHSESISAQQVRPPIGTVAPPSTWPSVPDTRQRIDAEAILADWLDEQAAGYVTPANGSINSAGSDDSLPPTPTEPVSDPNLEWKWIEAAASAWLSNRDPNHDGHDDPDGHV